MSIWDRITYDPMDWLLSSPKGPRPWWKVALLVLPWVLLLIGAAVIWFLRPGAMTEKYEKLAQNAPLDAMSEGARKQVAALEERRKALQDHQAWLSHKIEDEGTRLEGTKKEIATETHEQLRARLYGNDHD
jgi:hypothetical protein